MSRSSGHSVNVLTRRRHRWRPPLQTSTSITTTITTRSRSTRRPGRDRKRYAWLLGLIVPLAPFIAWGSVELTGFGAFWFLGPVLVFVAFPLLDIAIGLDAQQPARQRPQVARAGPLLPLVHLRLHPDPVRRPRPRLLAVVERRPLGRRKHRPGADHGRGRRDRDQHRPRARPQARQLGALAEPGRARPDRLRPLLHRAQPRPPRPRRHPRGPGQLAAGRELLGLPAAHRRRQPALGLGDRGRAARPARQVALDAPQRHPQRLGDDGRPLRRAGDRLRPGRPALPAGPGGDRLLAAGGRQLPRALRPAAPASARTAATSAACPSTAGTATTSPPTSCSTTCSATPTTTPTRPAATRRCATSTRRRSCRPATPG